MIRMESIDINIKNSSSHIVLEIDTNTVFRLIDLCKDKENNISKEFYDWYLIDSIFPVKNGELHLPQDQFYGEYILEFDVTNPDEVLLDLKHTSVKTPLASYNFYRQDNLTMNNITFSVIHKNTETFRRVISNANRKPGSVINEEQDKRIQTEVKENSDRSKFIKKAVEKAKKGGKVSLKNVTRKAVHELTDKHFDRVLEAFVYYFYATMYYMVRINPSIINKSSPLESPLNYKEIQAIHRYDGYIDLRKQVNYKYIDDDPDRIKRQYRFHIEGWTVRGHYRRINGKLVWINQFNKGSGPIEKRTYATVDRKKLDIPVKETIITKLVPITEPVKLKPSRKLINKPIDRKNPPAIQKILTFFKNIFNYLKTN